LFVIIKNINLKKPIDKICVRHKIPPKESYALKVNARNNPQAFGGCYEMEFPEGAHMKPPRDSNIFLGVLI